MNNLKHWALAVALLYGLILIALTCPVIAAAFFSEQGVRSGEVFQLWQYWVWIGGMVLCQLGLLGIRWIASQRGFVVHFLTVTRAD